MKVHMTYTTQAHGSRTLYQCQDCDTYFSDTKHTFLEGLRTPISRIWTVLEARTEPKFCKYVKRLMGRECQNICHRNIVLACTRTACWRE